MSDVTHAASLITSQTIKLQHNTRERKKQMTKQEEIKEEGGEGMN